MNDTVTCPDCHIQYTLAEYGKHWCRPSNISSTEKKPDTFCHIHMTFKEFNDCPDCRARLCGPDNGEEYYNAHIDDAYTSIVFPIVHELDKAQKAFPPFHSAHEGYSILYEEVCELWEVVREKQSTPGREDRLKKECIQVAAMAMRFLHDMKGFKN